MVLIDTVYQRVLALVNKEQRGYITPQEFNLFASQAQMEIFEQYFYDLNQAARVPGNDYVYADVDDMLEEKLQIFETFDPAIIISSYSFVLDPATGFPSTTDVILPNKIYRAHSVEVLGKVCELLKTKDFNEAIVGGPLTRPTQKRPIANVSGSVLRCVTQVGQNFTVSAIATKIYYSRRPSNVKWGYIVVGKKALYDPAPTKTRNFELHRSEESELVYRILKLAGVAMKRDDIMRAGQGLEISQIQQEKQ